MRAREAIAIVEFTVLYEGDGVWKAYACTNDGGFADATGEGSTPITALMVAEAKARKLAAKR